MYRLYLKKIFWIIIFLTFPLSVTAGGVLPVGKMEYEFLYEFQEHREGLSLAPDDFQLGPYRLEKFNTTLTPFEKLNNLSNKNLGLFSFISEDFRAAKDMSAKGYEAWRGGLFAQPHEKLFVYANFILDEFKAKDPDYTGKKWRGLAGDIENAFAYYRTQMIEVTVGRFASFWGPRNSLVLASGSSMDGFGYTIRWGRLSLSYRLAWLDGLNPDQDGVEQFENRYFAGHRLDINLSRKLRIGFFETVIFGGPGRNVDFYYLNPIFFYHGSQLNEGNPIFFYHGSQLNEGMDDNTFLGFDITFKPRPGYKLYGQLMVDDYQVDDEIQSDQEPSEYGLLAGGYITDFLNSGDLKIGQRPQPLPLRKQSHRRCLRQRL